MGRRRLFHKTLELGSVDQTNDSGGEDDVDDELKEEVCADVESWAQEYLAGRIAKGRMTEEQVAGIKSRFHVVASMEEAAKDAGREPTNNRVRVYASDNISNINLLYMMFFQITMCSAQVLRQFD